MEKIDTDFENWGAYLMKQFHAMFEKSERCDLEITCNKQVFLVHRLIMSACSDYVRELGETQHIILPEEISCKTLKTIIDFVYSGKIVFHKEDKDDLLIAASLLNMRLLLELIKREDSSSYTISMDDDSDENCDAELINNGTLDNCRISTDMNSERGPNSQTATKRKSDRKSVKNKSSKKNCLVLPPLHKFPYLQQKFSSSRTYGLITSFTSPSPSRFEISDAELEMNSVRSTFHDVTYDTAGLIDADSVKPLEADHVEFLKKNQKNTTANRRNFANALYSPFDKYTPPCNVKLSDSITTRRPESVVSYPSKAEAASNVRKYRVSNTAHSKETNSRSSLPQTVSTATPPVPARKEYKKPDTAKPASASTSQPVEKRVRFSEDVNVREIDIPFADAITNDLEELPEPIMPSAIGQDATSLLEGGHEVELIKLNNVVVPSDSSEGQRPNSMESEDDAISVSLVHIDDCDSTNTTVETISDFTVDEAMDVGMEANESTCLMSSELEPNFSTAPAFANESCVTQVPVDAAASVPEEPNVEANICPAKESPDIAEEPKRLENIICPVNESPGIAEEPKRLENIVCPVNESPGIAEEPTSLENIICSTEDSPSSSSGDKSSVTPERAKSPSVADSVSTDTTLFTPLNSNANSAPTLAEVSSQIFAFKVKGTESPAQINKLVDLCKNNPLFKDKKNLRFKIVPVKGALGEKLKDTTFKSGGSINKAIIVKRTVNSTSASATASADRSPAKLAAASQRVNPPDDGATNAKKELPFMENVAGPWLCTRCGAEPLNFKSYYDFRIHQHSVHKEPNNPVYCAYCGHKSLKRNMQLYHLFVKHNLRPPSSHVQFPKCDKCEFYALNEYYLQKHLICHPSEGKEYVCSCKVAFKSSDLLQKHMVSGDCKNTKSFTCGYCRGIFDRFVNLKAHMRVCMKERSKPMLESGATSNSSSSERSVKTISDGGKDYLSL